MTATIVLALALTCPRGTHLVRYEHANACVNRAGEITLLWSAGRNRHPHRRAALTPAARCFDRARTEQERCACDRIERDGRAGR